MTHKAELNTLTQVVHKEQDFLTALNANFQSLQKVVDETLSRVGQVPNQMESALDMNGNRIINVQSGTGPNDVVTRKDIQYVLDQAEAALAEINRLTEEAKDILDIYAREILQQSSDARDAAQAAQAAAEGAADRAAISYEEARAANEAAQAAREGAEDSEGRAQDYAEDSEDWFNQIYGARKRYRNVIIGTPSGDYTGGTDKIETGIDLTDKTIDLFWNGQLIQPEGNWSIDPNDNENILLLFNPQVGSTITLWINDTLRVTAMGDLNAHNASHTAHPYIRSLIDQVFVIRNWS